MRFWYCVVAGNGDTGVAGLLRPAKRPALPCLDTLCGRLAATEEAIAKELFRHSKAGLFLMRPTPEPIQRCERLRPEPAQNQTMTDEGDTRGSGSEPRTLTDEVRISGEV